MSVLSWSELETQLNPLRKGKKVVFTNGCFDLLHVGHVRYLKEACDLGDILVVGLNSDESVRNLKGPSRPVQNENDRAEILTHLKSVNFVVLFSEPTPLELIKFIRPEILVKGGDWAISEIVGSEVVKASGGEVLSLKFFEGSSSTDLIDRIQNKN